MWFAFFVFFSTGLLAEGIQRETSLSIGPEGISINPAQGPGFSVGSKEKGVYEMNFSISGALNRQKGQSSSPPVRILSPAASSPALTDSDTFFKGVGKIPADANPPSSVRRDQN